ncbi:MAG TPA: alpha/beta hydrolase, partial [Candidatus Dormibacteraeota bacterium]|nr:alpha/beta hydrolase [Candidatus Dormibacteraeota bacterium]
ALPQLQMPVLFTCGEYDEALAETVEKHRRLVPGAQLHVFKGAAHASFFEVPDEYRRVVASFLAANAP